MMEPDSLTRIQARRHLEEINEYILHGGGEIRAVPGKLTLIWFNPASNAQAYLSVKLAGDEALLINGRRYPATEAGLQQGLRAILVELH